MSLLTVCDRMGKPVDQVALIDIDAEVIALCRRWMPRLCDGAFADPRSKVIIGDAFDWIAPYSPRPAPSWPSTWTAWFLLRFGINP